MLEGRWKTRRLLRRRRAGWARGCTGCTGSTDALACRIANPIPLSCPVFYPSVHAALALSGLRFAPHRQNSNSPESIIRTFLWNTKRLFLISRPAFYMGATWALQRERTHQWLPAAATSRHVLSLTAKSTSPCRSGCRVGAGPNEGQEGVTVKLH